MKELNRIEMKLEEVKHPDESERRARMLGQLVLSDSIRAAKEKASNESEPASDSDMESLDNRHAGALGSYQKQLSFDLKLDSEGNDGFETGIAIRKKKPKVDLSNIVSNLESGGECASSWNQLWTILLDFQESEIGTESKQENESNQLSLS